MQNPLRNKISPEVGKKVVEPVKKLAGGVVSKMQPIFIGNAKVNCPHCSSHPTLIGVEGKVQCPNCQSVYYEWNPASVLNENYEGVKPEHQEAFGDILIQVVELIEENDFPIAMERLKKAFRLYPDNSEAHLLQSFLCYFTTPKSDLLKGEIRPILRQLEKAENPKRPHLEVELRQALGFHLYHFLRKRIEYIHLQKESEWYKLESISSYIFYFKLCYFIYQDTYFLKELVNHYYGHRQFNWFDYKIINLYLEQYEFVNRIIGKHNFTALDLDQIIQEIQSIEPDYYPPEILGGDFENKVRKSLPDLLTYRKLEAEKQSELDRIAHIEAEEQRRETEARKARAKVIARRNRIVIGVLFGIFLITVIVLMYSYLWYIVFLGLLFLAVFKGRERV